MTGIFTSKTLSGGHLANTVTVVYQTPASNVGYVKSIHITSNTANTQQVFLYKTINGIVIPWYQFTLAYGETADVLEGDTITLSANDSISANTNAATTNAASFSIHGVEEK